KCCRGGPTSIRHGWRRLLATTPPSNGPSRRYARRIMFVPPCAAWNGPGNMACTSFRKAWSRARPSAPRFPALPPTIPTTASWLVSAVASRITTSTSATKRWGDGDARGLVLSLSDHLLSERPQLHRKGARPQEGRLPQERQRLPGRLRPGGIASCCGSLHVRSHPQAARVLDAYTGAEVFQTRAGGDEPAPFLCRQSDRILSQLHLQTQLSHPQDLRTRL